MSQDTLSKKSCGDGSIDIRMASLVSVPYSIRDENALVNTLSILVFNGWSH